jgi:NAD(P)-dependent dehydrogenase (short-subunit alcohol dehydrogenase family)
MGFGFHADAGDVVRGVDLSGRQIVLTGASSGIGVETARALAMAGADLVQGVRDLAKGEEALGELPRGRLFQLDLADLNSVEEFAARIEGPVDALIANAGVSKTPDAHLPTVSTCVSRPTTSATSIWRTC